MKLAIILLSAALLQANANLHAQKVTISGKDITLKQVFNAIEKQTDFIIFSNEQFLTNTRKVSLTVQDISVTELLDLVLKNQPITYTIRNRTIILSQKEKPRKPDMPVENFVDRLNAAPLTISGVIRSAENEFLHGASVRIKNSNSGTTTDGRGTFQLKTAEEKLSIIVSMVGYEPEEFAIAKTANGYHLTAPAKSQARWESNIADAITLFVFLKKSVNILDETVVTAYGKTTKRLATGNISTVKGEDIQRQPVMTVLEALTGRVPGMVVSRISGNSASPINILIRGRNTINPGSNTDPLYVIDGIPITTLNVSPYTSSLPTSMGAVQGGLTNTFGENPLLNINPRDIERVDVLKDADATAIYGSRGANGVIMITTKKPKSGPTRVNLNISNGIKYIQKYPRMLNTQEYLAVRREALRNDGIQPDIYDAPDLLLWDPNKYTNWHKVLANPGIVTSVDANVGGGNSQTAYSLSAGYSTHKEAMNNGGKNNRVSFGSSVNHTNPNQKFRFSLNNLLSFTTVNAYGIGDLANFPMPPNAPDIYNEKGEFNFAPYRGREQSNFPFFGLKRPSESKTFSLQSSINLSYEIVKGLTITTTAGYQFNNNKNAFYFPLASTDVFFPGAVSSANYGSTNNKSFTAGPQLSYMTNIGRGNLSVQLVGRFQSVNTGSETIAAQQFPNDALLKSHNNAGQKTFTEGYKEYKYIAAAGIIKYTWDNKYVIDLNANRDGSSRFGPGKQFGNFGSIGAAWIASDESWVQRVLPSWISFVKFRGSIGTTGSENVGDYEYLSRWANTVSLVGRKMFGYGGVEAFHVVKPLNQEFQWESSTKSEISTTWNFLNDRFTVEVATYRNVSGNQLTSIPTPFYTGFGNAYTNWDAKIANKGIEISVTGKVIETKNSSLSVFFNISRNRNKLLEFPNLATSSYNGQLKVGQPTSIQYLLHYTGIDPMTGSYTFEDYNKDGNINAGITRVRNSDIDDRYIPIDMAEKYFGNIGLSFIYKSISCNTNLEFRNKYRTNPYLAAVVGAMNNVPYVAEIMNNHWRKPGDNAQYPRFTTDKTALGPIEQSDAYYVNGSFVRMGSLSVMYSLPGKWLSKVKIKGASISIETSNLFTISAYKGIDPEITTAIESIPIPRVINTSLQFNF